jgi:hypothetical protein
MDPTNPRKKTGAKIEIKVLMRQPLNKEHIIKKTHQWMVVAFGGTVSNQVSIQDSIPTKSTDLIISMPAVKSIEPPIRENIRTEVLVETVLAADKIPIQPTEILSEPVLPAYQIPLAPIHIESPPSVDIDSLEIQFYTYISD